MKRIFIPTQSGSDWQRLLAKPTLHWKPGRSAMTTAASWEASSDKLPPEITELLNASGHPSLVKLKLLAAIPEWQVPLPGGDRPSCTDVLALTRNEAGLCVIAVEAKVDEDFGPTVGEKRTGASVGQRKRISYLENLLGGTSFADGIRYQLLHRTASALLTAQEFHATTAVMLIHSFGTRPETKADFLAFCDGLQAEELPGGMRIVRKTDTTKLILGWCDGDRAYKATDLPLLQAL